jgi:hypothetical protein
MITQKELDLIDDFLAEFKPQTKPDQPHDWHCVGPRTKSALIRLVKEYKTLEHQRKNPPYCGPYD